MRNCKSLILCSVIAVLVLATGASAQSILINGDFETGDTTGWEINGGSSVATVVVETPDNGPTLPGMYNAFMENRGEALGLNMKQSTGVGSAAPGTINYSYDLKLDEADLGGVIFVEMFAEKEGVGIVGGSGLMGPLWPWNAWQNYTGSWNAPAGTEFITIQFVAATGATVGSTCVMHVDNVIVESENAVASEESSWSNVKALYR
jgi:hypothetical protein